MRAWLIPVAAYLLGSIPFGYLLVRSKTGGDVRAQGSGNIGATNVMRVAGRSLGLLTLLLDGAKGFAAVALADVLSYHSIQQPYVFMETGTNLPGHHFGWIALALVLVLAGHAFTPWLRFRGGKGVAAAAGAFLALSPSALGWAVVIFLVLLAASRFVSLASLAASLAFPFLLWHEVGSGYPPIIYVATAVAIALIFARHAGNIGRLLRGQEHRFGQRVALAPGGSTPEGGAAR